MHFSLLVVTSVPPTKEVLTSALAQFSESEEGDDSNSKWDWWELGGRWSGLLKAKPGHEHLGTRGLPGLNGTRHSVDGFDLLPLSSVDLERMEAEDGKLSCFAFLRDGEWVQYEDDEAFAELLAQVPSDHWISVVDCHN